MVETESQKKWLDGLEATGNIYMDITGTAYAVIDGLYLANELRLILGRLDKLDQKLSDDYTKYLSNIHDPLYVCPSYPLSETPQTNGGQVCDNPDGPCSCGAWH